MTIGLIKSALRFIQNRSKNIYYATKSFLIEICTEKAWLLDYIPSAPDGRDSIMLVRLDVIGDFVLWLDSARAYRSIYPNKKIVLYANASWADLASQLNHWDEVISVDMLKLRSDELYRIKSFYDIRRRGFSIAIQPTYSREYMGDMLMRASHAGERIGYVCDSSNILLQQKNISDRWYTRLIPSGPDPMMELKRNAEFVRELC